MRAFTEASDYEDVPEAWNCQFVDLFQVSRYLTCQQEEAENMLRHRKLGFSFVRLLPKETGVRPIVNLSKKNAVSVLPVFLWSSSYQGSAGK